MLTIFVGTLTDYFRAGFPKDDRPDRAQLQPRVEEWRKYITDGLVGAGHVESAPNWSEEPQEAFTHVLTVEALQALRLLLVHTHGCAEPPTELPAKFDEHPKWKEAFDGGFEEAGAFDQILVPEMWWPDAEFDFTFECPYPDGHEVQSGSIGALRRQLLEVGRSKLPGTTAQRDEWRTDVPQGTRDMATLTRYAFAALDASVTEAVQRGLPMLLHW